MSDEVRIDEGSTMSSVGSGSAPTRAVAVGAEADSVVGSNVRGSLGRGGGDAVIPASRPLQRWALWLGSGSA